MNFVLFVGCREEIEEVDGIAKWRQCEWMKIH